MKNRMKYVTTLVLIVGIVGLFSQSTVSATQGSMSFSQTWTGHSWTGTWTAHTWTGNTWSHTRQQTTVTVVSTAGYGGYYYGGGNYGQYPYYNQNPYYNPYCAPGSSYCSPYGANPYCSAYNNQNPYCSPYYNYNANNCVNSPYCSPYTAYPYQYATTTQQFTPQVIVQNVTVTQSVTATPSQTQVTLAASTEANTDQTPIWQSWSLIATCVILGAIAVIAVLLFTSRGNSLQQQTTQAPQQFTPQRADKKFCHSCGSGLSRDSIYCASCGTKVI